MALSNPSTLSLPALPAPDPGHVLAPLRRPLGPAIPAHPTAHPHVLPQVLLLQDPLPVRQMLPPLPKYIWRAQETAAAALAVAVLQGGEVAWGAHQGA